MSKVFAFSTRARQRGSQCCAARLISGNGCSGNEGRAKAPHKRRREKRSSARADANSLRILFGGGLENLLLVRSRANVPDKDTRGSLHSHNFKKVHKSVTKSLDSWGTQYLISGTGLVGPFRLRRRHRCAVRILWVYHPRHSFSGTNPNRKSFIINRFDSYPYLQRQGRGHIRL